MRTCCVLLRVSAVVTLPVLLVLAGCAKSEYGPLARVTGTVTYKGKPVPNMMVNFMPTTGNRPSWGKTDASGRFEMVLDADYNGAEIGHHKVYFTPPATTIDMGKSKASSKALAEASGLTPEEMRDFRKKYGLEKSTQLEVDVKKDPEDFKLDLD